MSGREIPQTRVEIAAVRLSFRSYAGTAASLAPLLETGSESSAAFSDGLASVTLNAYSEVDPYHRALSLELPGSLVVGETYALGETGPRSIYYEVRRRGEASRAWISEGGTARVIGRGVEGVTLSIEGARYVPYPRRESGRGLFTADGTIRFAAPEPEP